MRRGGSVSVGAIVAVAPLAHDCSDGMNTVGFALKNTGTRRQTFGWLLMDAVAPVRGAGISLIVPLPQLVLALALALFGGFISAQAICCRKAFTRTPRRSQP